MRQSTFTMDRPLLICGIPEHAAAQYGDLEVVARETHRALLSILFSAQLDAYRGAPTFD